ncbi:hypothetical protein NEHOM01_1023 [Nematocida homosporus]|uniref:uncharacterized protein n=1 Tax=Nematocida homosporus TaxID=1912981 RepID=UPI00221F10E1|nr:uncharacterized protein NEHOM01_1023 [Nematocida homosporus]KAI5185731.1 hypothetical protein NEHOM01_1023 [Nematocida homosporus]
MDAKEENRTQIAETNKPLSYDLTLTSADKPNNFDLTSIESEPQIHRLPGDLKPNSYDLQLVLNPTTNTFYGLISITANVLSSTSKIVLHAESMDIDDFVVYSLASNAQTELSGSYKHHSPILTFNLDKPISTDTVLLFQIKYHAKVSSAMAGFYRSEFKTAKGTEFIYSTQFEATSARRALPCFDEPIYKAVFNVSIIAPANLTILSNADTDISNSEEVITIDDSLVDQVDSTKPYQKAVFKPTPLMSTYLLAWVIGDLEFVGAENIRVFSPKGQKEYGEFSLQVAVHCLNFFNDYFGIDYQMKKLDMVAIPDFAAGAMENWGLVTYRSSSLHFIKESTTARQKLQVAETVCHELAHQWFGNLVTMAWWNDLWLNEGFATWAGTLATATLAEQNLIQLDHNPWEVFLESDLSGGLFMDGKLSTHPIDVEVETEGQISSIFDAISYSKGASLIHMLANYVGLDDFQKGLQHYIATHKYRNTTTKDLWEAIETKTNHQVATTMKNWISTPGMPHIRVTLDKDMIVLTQSRYLPHSTTSEEHKELWNIFLTKKTFSRDRKSPPVVERVMFNTKTLSIPTSEFPLILNADAFGFYRVHYSEEVLQKYIVPLLREEGLLSPFDRFGIFRDIAALVADGHESATYALNVMSCISTQERYIALYPMVSLLLKIVDTYQDQPEIKLAAETELATLLRPYVAKISDFTVVSDDIEQQKLEVLAVSVLGRLENSSISHQALQELSQARIKSVHKEYKRGMYISLAKYQGQAGYEYLLDVLKNDPMESERLRALVGISFSQSHFKDVFKLFVEETPLVKGQDKLRMVYGLSAYKDREEMLKTFLHGFATICKNFEGNLDMVSRFVDGFIAPQYTPEAIEMARSFFADKKNQNDAWKSAVDRGLEEAEILMKFRNSNLEALLNWAQQAKTSKPEDVLPKQ